MRGRRQAAQGATGRVIIHGVLAERKLKRDFRARRTDFLFALYTTQHFLPGFIFIIFYFRNLTSVKTFKQNHNSVALHGLTIRVSKAR